MAGNEFGIEDKCKCFRLFYETAALSQFN